MTRSKTPSLCGSPGISRWSRWTALLESAEIREELKVKYLVLGAETNTSDGSARIFPVSHSSGPYPTCPYAGRVHESNTLYFKYFHDRRRVVLRCHDEGCKVSRQLVYPITSDSLESASPVVSRSSMHTCRHLIEFDPEDVYNEDKMRPYPLEDKIVAVLAGMGTGECLRLSCIKLPSHSLKCLLPSYLGKSKGVQAHLQTEEFCEARGLCITFRRSLARKLATDFGYTLYLEIKKDNETLYDGETDQFSADHLVVQLDSLWRVKPDKYKIVIIDEALSLVLHTRSPLMRNTTLVLQRLHYFLVNADQVMSMVGASIFCRPSEAAFILFYGTGAFA
jgi:hypothetical protein